MSASDKESEALLARYTKGYGSPSNRQNFGESGDERLSTDSHMIGNLRALRKQKSY